jgi:hypothetical protein
MKYLKKLFTLLVIALFACGFAACSSDDEEPEEPSLEVTPANLHGTWELAEWNGEALAEGTYCYIVFNRKDQTFEMYQKFDSMYGRHITGSFAIKNDPYQGYIISGSYDIWYGRLESELSRNPPPGFRFHDMDCQGRCYRHQPLQALR